MMGPCWEIKIGDSEEVEVDETVNALAKLKEGSQPAKNLTPEEQAQIAESQ